MYKSYSGLVMQNELASRGDLREARWLPYAVLWKQRKGNNQGGTSVYSFEKQFPNLKAARAYLYLRAKAKCCFYRAIFYKGDLVEEV